MTHHATVQHLQQKKAGLVAYLRLKTECEDWHGVQDAASDIREIDAQLALLHLQSAARIADAEGDR